MHLVSWNAAASVLLLSSPRATTAAWWKSPPRRMGQGRHAPPSSGKWVSFCALPPSKNPDAAREEEESLWFAPDDRPRTPAQEALQRYVRQVKAGLPEKDSLKEEEEGVACPGEPAIDPSRQVQSTSSDSEWMEDW